MRKESRELFRLYSYYVATLSIERMLFVISLSTVVFLNLVELHTKPKEQTIITNLITTDSTMSEKTTTLIK